MIERKIILGLITSTDYLKKIRPYWNSLLLESSTAAMLAKWCIDYYDKYKLAPQKQIQTIYYKQLKNGLDKNLAEEIEEDILPGLSEEYIEKDIHVDYLLQETLEHFQAQSLSQLSNQIQNILENGQGDFAHRLKEAEKIRKSYKPISFEVDENFDLDLSYKISRKIIRDAFNKIHNIVVTWPKQLGKFWNDAFIEGGFICLLAPEKRGKTYILLEIGMRASKQNKKVAFFQAGDMNRDDQLKRIGTYLCRKSAIENYCEEHYRPVRDCIKNQEDTCNKNERECNFGIFENFEYQGEIIKNSKKLTKTQLIEAYEMYEDYLPCSNCKEYDNYQLGTVWLEKVKQVDVLTTKEAVHAVDTFFIKNKRRFKLSTHANGTLSVKDIENILNEWFIDDGFVADIILIDYLELLVTEGGKEERHAQNKIAKELRKLSQTPKQNKLPLVVTATQSDAESYGANTLKMKHFSEDKRKYAHVTAMYGLNQDPQGREKEIGLLRINEIIKREGAFSNNKQITILQDLNQGRPFLGSYF